MTPLTEVCLSWEIAYNLAGCTRQSASGYRAVLFDSEQEDFGPKDVMRLEVAIAFCRLGHNRHVFNKLNFARLEGRMKRAESFRLLALFELNSEHLLSRLQSSEQTLLQAIQALYGEYKGVQEWVQSVQSARSARYSTTADPRSVHRSAEPG